MSPQAKRNVIASIVFVASLAIALLIPDGRQDSCVTPDGVIPGCPITVVVDHRMGLRLSVLIAGTIISVLIAMTKSRGTSRAAPPED